MDFIYLEISEKQQKFNFQRLTVSQGESRDKSYECPIFGVGLGELGCPVW